MPPVSQRGAASVEHVGLCLLIALLTAAGIASVAAGPLDGGRELGAAIARKLRCAPRLPGPCWRDPLTDAYGRSLGGAGAGAGPGAGARAGLMARRLPLLPLGELRGARARGPADGLQPADDGVRRGR